MNRVYSFAANVYRLRATLSCLCTCTMTGSLSQLSALRPESPGQVQAYQLQYGAHSALKALALKPWKPSPPRAPYCSWYTWTCPGAESGEGHGGENEGHGGDKERVVCTSRECQTVPSRDCLLQPARPERCKLTKGCQWVLKIRCESFLFAVNYQPQMLGVPTISCNKWDDRRKEMLQGDVARKVGLYLAFDH